MRTVDQQFAQLLHFILIDRPHPLISIDLLADEFEVQKVTVYKWIEGENPFPVVHIPRLIEILKKFNHYWQHITNYFLSRAGLVAVEIGSIQATGNFKKEVGESLKELAEYIQVVAQKEKLDARTAAEILKEGKEAIKEIEEVVKMAEDYLNE